MILAGGFGSLHSAFVAHIGAVKTSKVEIVASHYEFVLDSNQRTTESGVAAWIIITCRRLTYLTLASRPNQT